VIKYFFYSFLAISCLAVTFSFTQFKLENNVSVTIEDVSLEAVLLRLGDASLLHEMKSFDAQKAKMGEDIIRNGFTTYKGKKSKRISKYFVCTDCHNLTREFSNLASESPKERLAYANSHSLPFLQGSTFFGIYNRTKFYNGDYKKKYGELVDDARDSLDNAIQLCAEYCSSGRPMLDWELDAVKHYYKKNELQIKDLNLPLEIQDKIGQYMNASAQEKKALTAVVKKSYRQFYSATFLPTMPRENRKYGENGNVENGKSIYNKSCLHCHAYKRATNLGLDNGKLTGRMFVRNLDNYKDKSLYQIIRWGTYAKSGRKQYMPLYTEEKMSDEQINDLVAYIKQIAKK